MLQAVPLEKILVFLFKQKGDIIKQQIIRTTVSIYIYLGTHTYWHCLRFVCI